MKRESIFLLALLAMGVAQAGTVVHMERRSLPDGKPRPSSVLYAQSGQLRIDSLDGEGHVTDLVRGAGSHEISEVHLARGTVIAASRRTDPFRHRIERRKDLRILHLSLPQPRVRLQVCRLPARRHPPGRFTSRINRHTDLDRAVAILVDLTVIDEEHRASNSAVFLCRPHQTGNGVADEMLQVLDIHVSLLCKDRLLWHLSLLNGIHGKAPLLSLQSDLEVCRELSL